MTHDKELIDRSLLMNAKMWIETEPNAPKYFTRAGNESCRATILNLINSALDHRAEPATDRVGGRIISGFDCGDKDFPCLTLSEITADKTILVRSILYGDDALCVQEALEQWALKSAPPETEGVCIADYLDGDVCDLCGALPCDQIRPAVKQSLTPQSPAAPSEDLMKVRESLKMIRANHAVLHNPIEAHRKKQKDDILNHADKALEILNRMVKS